MTLRRSPWKAQAKRINQLNFADKALIGLARVPITKELNPIPREFGLMNSSFSFLFSLSTIGCAGTDSVRRRKCIAGRKRAE